MHALDMCKCVEPESVRNRCETFLATDEMRNVQFHRFPIVLVMLDSATPLDLLTDYSEYVTDRMDVEKNSNAHVRLLQVPCLLA